MDGALTTEHQEDGSLRRRKTEDEGEDQIGSKLSKTETTGLESCLDEPVELRSVHEVIKYGASSLPAKHYDPDTTEPISSGLQSLEELLSWKRSDANPFNVATVPLANREPSLASTPHRTLVSHDMMGGYLDDRFLQGAESDAPYVFYHWQYIDVFNYFSHNTVTIPPSVWTNAAHRHGVIVLGTFITEWTDGGKMCEVFLKEEESYRAVADRLVQIAHCYGFDGWLINIENPLGETAVKNTPLFLRYLTDQMHERVPGSMVLWYDSVLENGQLKWQNELNPSNRVFFSACDGIFTNYNWTEQNLEGMKAYSAAQGRLADIFVGVDVFARGEVVGGKLETNKALEMIRKHDFSTAIFAPGWVYESIPDKNDFRKEQDKFWSLLSDFLYVHRPSSPLPFVSSFCQGAGTSLYWRGQREVDRSWFNLDAQELQPLYYRETLEGEGWLRTQGCPEDAWSGGSSLLVEGVLPSMLSKVCARIFSLQVPLSSRVFVSLIYKPSPGVTVSLELKTADATLCTHRGVQDIPTSSIEPVALTEDHQLMRQFSQSCGQWNPDGWTVRCSQLELQGCALRDVCVSVRRDGGDKDTPFKCRVGEIMILDAESLSVAPLPVQSVCLYDVVWLRGANKLNLNATLRWRYPAQLVRHFLVYWRRLRGPDPRIPSGKLALIGRAYCPLFRVTELTVPEPPGLLELVVEPVSREGFRVPESQWGRRSLSYTEERTDQS
ncbi:cytosolic endo-beta-N-acetylglucosaminidase [Oncorhynchus kisutch]|uniref:Cytosolic endo-beta-N-acetylglucosaminidase n=1 Tax=Oncorhynchus kisutch TaxID=8019 RepID=A0A8C7HPC7_ONCKI|nr:cytosolic endo-beta-N-acetylglucosaminidase-like [Oncorhynchus kisutch]